MRRQLLIGSGIIVAVVALVGGLVLASQQGMFAEKEKTWLTEAERALKQGNVAQAQAKLEQLIAVSPDSGWTDDALLHLAEIHQQQHKLLEARRTCRTLLEKFPDSPLVERAQKILGDVNIALIFSPVAMEEDVVYTVEPGDTLAVIAKKNSTTVDFVRRCNDLKKDIIRPGQRLKIPKGTFSIVVDKSQRQLLLTRDGQFVKLYPVAPGRENSTPDGTFKIINRIENPVWYKQGVAVPPDSPENILGTRWLGLDKPGYGIHGTDEAAPITEQYSSGCIRMMNADVEELFNIIPIGTEVTIVD